MLFTCLLMWSAVLSNLWSLSAAVIWGGIWRGCHFFRHLSCSRESHLDLHTFKDNIPLREAHPCPHWWSWSHGVIVVMTKSLSCWWPDGGSSVVMTTSCMGHTQTVTINRPVFTENHASTSCFSPHLWHELHQFKLDLEHSLVLLRDEINSRIHPAVKWKCNHSGVQKYD